MDKVDRNTAKLGSDPAGSSGSPDSWGGAWGLAGAGRAAGGGERSGATLLLPGPAASAGPTGAVAPPPLAVAASLRSRSISSFQRSSTLFSAINKSFHPVESLI